MQNAVDEDFFLFVDHKNSQKIAAVIYART